MAKVSPPTLISGILVVIVLILTTIIVVQHQRHPRSIFALRDTCDLEPSGFLDFTKGSPTKAISTSMFGTYPTPPPMTRDSRFDGAFTTNSDASAGINADQTGGTGQSTDMESSNPTVAPTSGGFG